MIANVVAGGNLKVLRISILTGRITWTVALSRKGNKKRLNEKVKSSSTNTKF